MLVMEQRLFTLMFSCRTDGGHTDRVQACSGGRRGSREVCSHHPVHPGGTPVNHMMTAMKNDIIIDSCSLDGLRLGNIHFLSKPSIWRRGRIPVIPKVVFYLLLCLTCLALSCVGLMQTLSSKVPHLQIFLCHYTYRL